MCDCKSNFTEDAGQYAIANKSLGVKKYSNLSQSKAEEQCGNDANANPDAYTAAYGYTDSLSKCVEAKKIMANQNIQAKVGQGVGLLHDIACLFGNCDPVNTIPAPLPEAEPKGLSVGSWVVIGLGLATVITIIVIIAKKQEKNG